jgi:hypothetical protein
MRESSSGFHQGMARVIQVHLDAIASKGLSVQPVFADPERGIPSFVYTVGMGSQQLDEILVFGLPIEHAAVTLTELGRRRIEGEVFPLDEPFSIEAMRVDLVLKNISSALSKEWLPMAADLAGGPIKAQQLVWPDPAGKFPWDAGFDQVFANAQKLLFADQ